MATSLSRLERRCQHCGEPFWADPRAFFCSKACRQRAYRARGPFGLAETEVGQLCTQVSATERAGDSTSPRKLLPRLFRAVARELRLQGWDPIELLLSMPDDPVSADDQAPGGFEGEAPTRRKWLYPPEVEIQKLDELILQRRLEGSGVQWYQTRREQLVRLVAQRQAGKKSG